MIKLDFEKMGGIIPAIVQDYKTNEVLMLAFMNEEAWERTLETGLAHYYSRTRKCLWQKGKSSGHVQKVKEIYVDCDKDTVLLKVEQIGAACHTGYRSCFYRKLEGNDLKIVAEKVFEPEEVYKK
ncbi:MAG TPA: phosphoribosyl-AMP cyclohydrolase [Candidatus Desulfofervidus auxilii]|uniref:Phosphoribosyl-AMP cyclohydrolase n=1 Tax=Desulfofervidus auxilii TaxID=1621989 RepID=A0A7C0Y4V2_DESA2|nr:phosphoribosyl-AMP cyclohydrolase [Candidatus Desulfofervidus auxilii]